MSQEIDEYLKICPELTALCSQNGWIDNGSLRSEILSENPHETLLAVYFDEVVMEGSGCIAATKPCYGRIRVQTDISGKVLGIQIA